MSYNMTSKVHCLKRVGDNIKKYKLIILEDKNEVTVGRNPDVTVCLLSVMISRCHAVLKKTETGTWTIKDNKSLNGVFVNNNKLDPMKPHELHEGDVVQLGVRASPDTLPEFVFKYHTAMKVKLGRKAAEDVIDGKHTDLPDAKRARLVSCEAVTAGCSRRRTEQPTSDSLVTSSQPDKDCVVGSRLNTSLSKGDNSAYQQYRKKMDEQQAVAEAKMAEFEKKMEEMQRQLQEKESAQQELAQELIREKQKRENQSKTMESLKKKEQELKQEFLKKQEMLAKEKKEMEVKMKEELEDMLHVKEATLMESLENQRQGLLREKEEIEEKLKKELESEREKDKKLSEELLLQKQKLERVIENKETEKRLLESQLNDTVLEKDRKQEEVLRAREDVLSNFAELMETELQCSICNELFVKATSLNCSHGFCSLCIQQWMKVKKECPQCRAPITTHMRSIVLDSYIEKMVGQLSEEMKTQRQELVEERKKEEAAFEEANKPQPPASARGRGRGRGGRGRGARGNLAAPPPPDPPPPPITISDNDDEDSFVSLSGSNSDESDDVDSSDAEGPYWGGYGRCYNCGDRGHWANRCPFR